MRESTSFMCYGSRAQGWFFIGLGLISFMVFVYAAILSNFFTVSEYSASTTIKVDRVTFSMRKLLKHFTLSNDIRRDFYAETHAETLTVAVGPAQWDPLLQYYCFLVPLTIPILFVAVYFHWLSMKFFKHA